MKIRFESDDDLAISKIIKVPVCVVNIRVVFEEDKPEVLLHDCFYEHEEDIKTLIVNGSSFL